MTKLEHWFRPGKSIKRDVNSQLPQVGVPPLSRTYWGRQAELKALRDHLQLHRNVAIHGLSGTGKTQLAVKYASEYREDYAFVWWIRGEDRVTLNHDFDSIAAIFSNDAINQSDRRTRVLSWLDTEQKWLLIVDGLNDPNLIKDLPLSNLPGHHILLTSTRSIKEVKEIRLYDWSNTEAAAYLAARTQSNDHRSLKSISTYLDNLPLALDSAADFMQESFISPAAYLELIKPDSNQWWGAVSERARAYQKAWSLAINEAEKEVRGARNFLALLASFGVEAVPRKLPAYIGSDSLPGRKKPKWLAKFEGDERDTLQDLQSIRDRGLLSYDADNYYMHSMVREVTLAATPFSDRHMFVAYAAAAINGYLDNIMKRDYVDRVTTTSEIASMVDALETSIRAFAPNGYWQEVKYPVWDAMRESARSFTLLSLYWHNRVGDDDRSLTLALRAFDLAENALIHLLGYDVRGSEDAKNWRVLLTAAEVKALALTSCGRSAEALQFLSELDGKIAKKRKYRLLHKYLREIKEDIANRERDG